MSQAYIGSVKANAPQAEIVFDRFHVQRLAHDALDQVCAVRSSPNIQSPNSASWLKKTRFVLQKNPENLSSAERQKLADVQANVARAELHGWLAWVSRSKLAPFGRVARTIRKRLHGILAYLNTRLSNGWSEGLNGKVRVITRRSYGLHSAKSLIAMPFWCCSLPALTPVKVLPNTHPLAS
jgi:transposase